ncbi:MAG: adenosylmethionine decarboxylase [Proteobacteria bacterium]|nr:MAG: adenosylmethionine decarboxylase [Pseudomonadota bacterium]
MKRVVPFEGPIKLEGFNNLTKALSFNLYDFCVARNEAERESYVKYIYDKFSAKKVTGILTGICDIIEANVLAVSDQDYDPWGASSLVLMSDIKGSGVSGMTEVKMHLDKSHICAHTYPDFRADGQVCSFRIDIDIATCGEISPLNALNYMFEACEADVVIADYVVRGYTRDTAGRRVFMDHDLRSIQEYIDPKILEQYHCVDLSLQSENIWQTKMIRTKMDERTYFIENATVDLDSPETRKYLDMVKNEMRGLVYQWPE